MSVLLLLSILRLSGTLAPQQTAQPPQDRQPLQELMRTEVVYPQERHATQATVVSSFDRHRQGSTFALPLHLEFGLTDSWEIDGEYTPASRETLGDDVARGLSGAGFGTKYSFMRIKGSRSHAAIGVDVERSLGEPAVGSISHAWETSPFLSVAHDYPHGFQIFGQIGTTFTRVIGESAADDSESGWQAFGNAGALKAFHRFTIATEINSLEGANPLVEGRALYVTPSVTFHLGSCCEIGVGASGGLTAASDRYSVIVQLIVER